MSEIKGQILGIVLVLMIFATVSTALGLAFKGLTDSVSAEVSQIKTSL